ncbi:hypothetical protein vBVpaS1601_73 [Vibrio phage vB_VpaS_1601]|uniref:hypothetical protein n=1 Tax=Vibrio phage SHOU24 TaxID=1414739 RepID=UPI0003ED1E19|nr:hypothetical protein SHOU24_08 [Vibrio phage SHOU24]AHI61205.1 hypothetical protein SHOU24_08 [Vibrio phage SHOU24]WHM52766.1 hypothetical protein vBVpaP1601_73 [Vibrio phage vB_VpaP_1601]
MNVEARIKSTGEIVRIVSSLYGKVEVRHVNRPKIKRDGKMVFVKSRMLFRDIEFL